MSTKRKKPRLVLLLKKRWDARAERIWTRGVVARGKSTLTVHRGGLGEVQEGTAWGKRGGVWILGLVLPWG